MSVARDLLSKELSLRLRGNHQLRRADSRESRSGPRPLSFGAEQLPGAHEQPGFSGFHLLADRAAGKLMTISLWESYDDVRAVESRAALFRSEAAGEIGAEIPGVEIYEIAIQA